MILTIFEAIFVEICNETSRIFKKLYFFKNSMFKHSYRDGVDPLRSALKKEVYIESFIEFRRNRIYFVQNLCSIASLLGGCFTFFARCRAGI